MMQNLSVAAKKLFGYDVSDERPSGERWVTISNALVHAAHGLSLPEKQVVMLAVSKLDSRKFHGKDNLPRVRLTSKEFAEAYDLDPSYCYKALKDAANHLYDRSIVFREQDHSRKKTGRKTGEVTMRCRWIGSQKYHTGEGWVELVFWPEIVPHLTALKKRFTSYQMKQVAGLRSSYSWRLLELLMQYENKGKEQGEAVIELEDFQHAMEAPPSLLINFGALRRRIIEPAVKELREKDSWLIDWEPIKRGRKVHQLRFRFARNPQGNLFEKRLNLTADPA